MSVTSFAAAVRGTRFGVAELVGPRFLLPRTAATQAPLYALNDAAVYRIEAVTQVLESLSMRGSIKCQSFILSDFALLCAIPLRDGCDVLETIRQRLGALPLAKWLRDLR